MHPKILLISILFPIFFAPMIGCEVSPPNKPAEIPDRKGFSLKSPKNQESDAVLRLPFAPWIISKCPTWMFVDEKDANSTKHDVAFETYAEIMELFAPVTGFLYVHDAQDGPFGHHITIDLSDGTYVVLGGFTSISATNEQSVVEGQLLGYTQNPSQVILGQHKGDAKQPAHLGTSLPALYRAYSNDPYTGTLYDAVWLACAQVSDESDKTEFTSGLAIVQSHPDGTIAKTPDSPDVYLMTDQKRQRFANKVIMESHGYVAQNIVTISNMEMDGWSEDKPIDLPGFQEAVTDDDGIWLIRGQPTDWNRYRIRVHPNGWEAVLKSWGLPFYNTSNPPPCESKSLVTLANWPIKKGFARFRRGTLVKEPSSVYPYVVSDEAILQFDSWDTFFLMGYVPSQIIEVQDGTLGFIHKTIGDCEKQKGCVTTSSVASYEYTRN